MILKYDYYGFRIFNYGMASFQKPKKSCSENYPRNYPSNFPDTDQKASLSITLKIFLILFNYEPRSRYSYKSE